MSFMTAKSSLINELLMTKEFNQLRLAKNRLFENKEYMSAVNDYQQKHYQAMNSGDEKAFKELEAEYRRLAGIPEIKSYFTASEAMEALLMNLMNDINGFIENNLR